MKAFVVPNFEKKETANLLDSLARLSKTANLELCFAADPHNSESFEPESILPEQLNLLERCDIILAIGGDGTIMHCARLSAMSGKPIMGINAGRLGFLAQVEAATLEHSLGRLAAGDYTVEYRSAISAQFNIPDCPNIPFAINDIVLTKAGEHNMAQFEMFCDNRRIGGYRADGLILCTSTGSTAYNLSAGGPVIDPLLDAITMVPICPHTLSVRPMVFSKDRVITVHLGEAPVSVVADGSGRRLLPAGSVVEIKTAEQKAGFIAFHEQEFFEIVTKKIKERG